MSERFRRVLGSRMTAAVASASVAVAVLGATNALANHDANVIHACKNKTNGNVRIVTSASDCLNSEVATEWNIQGPQGPQGPQGLQGEQGIQGPAGPPGISGYQRVFGAGVSISPGTERALSVSCPAGKLVFGGGVSMSQARMYTEDTYPISDTRWQVYVWNGGTTTGTARPYAVCAAVASQSTAGNVALNTVDGTLEETPAAPETSREASDES